MQQSNRFFTLSNSDKIPWRGITFLKQGFKVLFLQMYSQRRSFGAEIHRSKLCLTQLKSCRLLRRLSRAESNESMGKERRREGESENQLRGGNERDAWTREAEGMMDGKRRS